MIPFSIDAYIIPSVGRVLVRWKTRRPKTNSPERQIQNRHCRWWGMYRD